MLSGTTITLTVHILLLVGWFGVDIAVAVCAWSTARTSLDSDTRLAVAKLASVMQLGPTFTPFVAAPVAIVLLRWSGSTSWGGEGVVGALALCLILAVLMARCLSTVDAAMRLRFSSLLRLVLAVIACVAVASSVVAGPGKGLVSTDALRLKTLLFAVAVAAGVFAGQPVQVVIDGSAALALGESGAEQAGWIGELRRRVRTSLLWSATSWLALAAAVVVAANRAG